MGRRAGAPEQIYVHLGGGVGACVIVADRIGGGSTGYAGELGHITVPGGTRLCQCGKVGCLETLASAPAVTEIAGVADLEELRRMLASTRPAPSSPWPRRAGPWPRPARWRSCS